MISIISDLKEKTRPYVRYIPAFTIFLILLIFLSQMILYINRDVAPSFTDAHYLRTLDYLDYFNNPLQKNFPAHEYPPLTHLVSLIFLKIIGVSLQSARFSLVVFAVIYILSMYGIGKELGDEVSGIAVCALAASSPHILLFSRMFFLDFPQTAMTALVFYLILKSNYYRNTLFSILIGVALGLSMLTKWSTIFFIFLPMIWFIIPAAMKSLKSALSLLASLCITSFFIWRIFCFFTPGIDPSKYWLTFYITNIFLPIALLLGASFYVQKVVGKKANQEKGKDNPYISIINFLRACLLSILIFSPWLFYNAAAVRTKVFLDFTHYHKDISQTFFSTVQFLKFSFNYAIILVIIGIIFMFIRRKDIFRNLILPLNIIFAFLIMMKMGYPHARYILSFVIFMSALGGWWVCKAGKLGKILTVFIVIISLVSMTGWLLFPGESPLQEIDTRRGEYDITGKSQADLVVTNILPLTVQGPNKNRYDITPVLNALKNSLDGEMDGREDILLKINPGGAIGDHEFVDFLAIEMRKNNIPLDTSRFWGYNQFINVSGWDEEMERHMSGIERILVKHPTDLSIRPVISKLKDLHGGVDPRVVRCDLPQDISVTLIIFKIDD
ncbi:MAG: glycosyltransferase family 39 protein [Candidatus Eremiobacteraeota bacterium]|nr:glycosyltransferase family 39 protein [Candidatus Eremiobacteraeota bacterium]